MIRFVAGLGIAGLVLSLSGFSLVLHAAEPVVESAHPTALAVNLVQPEQQDWPLSLSLSGGIYPWQEAVVAAELGGQRITTLAVDIGASVKKGQLLAELSKDSIEASVALQQANLLKAKVALTEAKTNAERARKMKGQGTLSDQQISQYLLAEQSALASVTAAEALLHTEQIRLNQTRILAPDDGLISARSATLGSVLQSGSELFRLLRRNRLEWRAEASAEHLAQLQQGQSAQLVLADGTELSGKVRLLAPILDNTTRKALVYVDLPPNSAARAGMFASGTIRLGNKLATLVPNSALVLRDGHSYLFAVNAQRQVQQLPVSTGRRQADKVEITTTLPESVQLVASGGAFLNDGDFVRVEPVAAQEPTR